MTGELTDDEIDFLEHHGLSESDVFDWRGYNSKVRARALKAAGKTLALGAPCGNGGHRLRTRAGHCVQCDPAKLAYQSRRSIGAVLYAANSSALGGFKVGISEQPVRRIADLNRESYGGASDWQLFMARELDDAGKSEANIHRLLSEFSQSGHYRKGDHVQTAREIFSCSPTSVISAFKASITEEQLVEGGFSQPPPRP